MFNSGAVDVKNYTHRHVKKTLQKNDGVWPVVVLTEAVPFSLFALLWCVNMFIFVCTENILNSNPKTPCLPLPVTVVSKSNTISTPLEGGCPFFSEMHLSGSSIHTNHLRASTKLTLLLSLVARWFFNLQPLPCAWDVQS